MPLVILLRVSVTFFAFYSNAVHCVDQIMWWGNPFPERNDRDNDFSFVACGLHRQIAAPSSGLISLQTKQCTVKMGPCGIIFCQIAADCMALCYQRPPEPLWRYYQHSSVFAVTFTNKEGLASSPRWHSHKDGKR